MPGRSFSSPSYRYGFNSKEKDDEVKGGNGSSLDFGARFYDSRLGRWLSVDKSQGIYPDHSPYDFGIDNPVKYVDENGKWLGVTYMFFEGSVGGGIGLSVYDVEQSGLASDDVGKTHFQTRTFLHVDNQNLEDGSSNPNVIFGAELNAASANIKLDWSSNTYFESIGVSAIEFKSPFALSAKGQVEVPSTKVGFGISGSISTNSITIGAGFSAGFTASIMSTEILESISLDWTETETVNELSNLAEKNWFVRNINTSFDANGNITGYIGTVYTHIRDSNSEIQDVNTGIQVFSGVQYDSSGEASSNNIWASQNYINRASEIEKKDNE